MVMLQLIGDALWSVVGSLIAAILLCWLAWRLFKLIRHPEFGVPVALGLGVLLHADQHLRPSAD